MKDLTVILLNGPPGCGKDALGEELTCRFACTRIAKFAGPIKAACAGLIGTTIDALEMQKNDPHPPLTDVGVNYRQLMVSMGEDWLKPMFGVGVMGSLLAKRILRESQQGPDPAVYPPKVWIITDLGFVEEAQVVRRWLNEASIVLVRVHRDGCDFYRDSRVWVHGDALRIPDFAIYNVGTIEDLGDRFMEKFEAIEF